MVEVLSLVLHHDEQAVLAAVELALEAGVPSKTHVLSVLYRLLDGTLVLPSIVTAPQALRLTQEPRANVLRYDSLRWRAPNPASDVPSPETLNHPEARHAS